MSVEKIISLIRNNQDPRKMQDIRRVWPELADKLSILIGENTEVVKPQPALRDDVGKLALDFSAGLPSPVAIKNQGYVSVIHYVSDPRANWMIAKPVKKAYADQLKEQGITNVSNYQFGKADTSDWLFGYDNGIKCAKRALELHYAAGGPPNSVIYASIDAAPSTHQINNLVIPYLKGFASVVGVDKLGVYGNSLVIDECLKQNVGQYFWQHNWHEGKGFSHDHPFAHIHQIRIDKDKIDGIGVDINVILKKDYGQWR